MPDSKKGEQIILVTTCPFAERTAFAGWVSNHGVHELAIPRRFVPIDHIPVLGTGKTDYVKVARHVQACALEEAAST